MRTYVLILIFVLYEKFQENKSLIETLELKDVIEDLIVEAKKFTYLKTLFSLEVVIKKAE